MSSGDFAFVRPSALPLRSISAENRSCEPGAGGRATQGTGAYPARNLAQGWKVSPCMDLPAGSTIVLADVTGPGVLQHFWISVRPEWWRALVLQLLVGQPGHSLGGGPAGRLFRPRVGRVRDAIVEVRRLGGVLRAQLVFADAVSHRGESRTRERPGDRRGHLLSGLRRRSDPG